MKKIKFWVQWHKPEIEIVCWFLGCAIPATILNLYPVSEEIHIAIGSFVGLGFIWLAYMTRKQNKKRKI